MIEWNAAEECLFELSRDHVTRFLNGPIKDEIYAFGFYCDAFNGDVLLTADALDSQEADEQDRWDSGNWKYPGGLFPAVAGGEQWRFDQTWRLYGQEVARLVEQEVESRTNEGVAQSQLEALCLRVLQRLISAGVFENATALEDFTILGPDDSGEAILAKKQRLERILNWRTE